MKPQQRDELLVRLDERSCNTFKIVEQLEQHQTEQNGLIRDAMNRATISLTWVKAFRWIIGISFGAIAAWITKIQKWW